MPCHRNAMGSNRQTVPKVCRKKGCKERKGERDKGSVKWWRSAVCRPPNQQPSTPLNPPRFLPLSPSIVSAAIPAPIQKARWGAKAIMALHCLFIVLLFYIRTCPTRERWYPSIPQPLVPDSGLQPELSVRDSLITSAVHAHTFLSAGHNLLAAAAHSALQDLKHFSRSPLETVIIHHWLYTNKCPVQRG